MKFRLLITTILAVLGFSTGVFAHTVINIPLDSRPVSYEYFDNLSRIGGDNCITVSKDNLDYFSNDTTKNHLGNSLAVRDEVYNLVLNNNNKDTTVIINTSSYVTNGLVGSRCGVNYKDYKDAMEDLNTLITNFPNPKYYINIANPRSLPETRFNTVWCDSNKSKGLASYYLELNPNDPNKDEILNTYAMVTPEQFLLEYGYVYNKSVELGYGELTKWEKAFLNNFNTTYLSSPKYKPYIDNYILPYSATADMFSMLLKWQQEGKIDQILVGNDDLQLPNCITYFYRQNASWVQSSKGSAVKYSFPRSYMEVLPNSIQNTLKEAYGNSEKEMALIGYGKKVNIIYGTDELPQLTYARDYSIRNNLTPKYNLYYNDHTQDVATFDVSSPSHLIKVAINYASGRVGQYTKKDFNTFIYNYTTGKSSKENFLDKLYTVNANGGHTGLIELYVNTQLDNSRNYIFQQLSRNKRSDQSVSKTMNLSELDMYSAWNTQANAIGLGIAHAQVFTIADQVSKDTKTALDAHLKVLLQHYIEDSEYTATAKLTLANKAYKPTVYENQQSQILYDLMNPSRIENVLKGCKYTFNGDTYYLDNIKVVQMSFPWSRIFDILVKSQAIWEDA